MKLPKFQVGEIVQTIDCWKTPPTKDAKGVIKYRYYRPPGGGLWFYVVQPVGTNEHEGIVYSENTLELSSPVEVVHCCCNKNNSNSPKFHKGQKVKVGVHGEVYFGKINYVINMKTHYDYYVDVRGYPTMCNSTMRCNENDIEFCCCSCYCCCSCCCHCC